MKAYFIRIGMSGFMDYKFCAIGSENHINAVRSGIAIPGKYSEVSEGEYQAVTIDCSQDGF